MTREQFAKKIGWPIIFMIIGGVNVCAMIPQVTRLLETKSSRDVAPMMVWIYLTTQIAFGFEGWLRRSRTQWVTMALSASVSVITLALIYYYRA